MSPAERFTQRAEDYAKFRPRYPDELVVWLEGAGLTPGAHIVDIGAGTGISSELFLRHGYRVTAVEPNAAMRAEAVKRLSGMPGFAAVDARGDRTGLPSRIAGMVLCAQAFHWLEAAESAREFRRIARPGGLITLVWNERRVDAPGFEQGLETLLKNLSPEYRDRVYRRTRDTVAQLPALFGPLREAKFLHTQTFDWEGLRGRMASASYVPLPGTSGHEEFLLELRRLFDLYNDAGRIVMAYDCEVYCAVAASRL